MLHRPEHILRLAGRQRGGGQLKEAERYYRLALSVDPDCSLADELMLRRSAKAFPQRRAIRSMLLTRMADFTWSAYQESKSKTFDFTPRVFMYWGQGFDVAPPIVQTCLAAAKSLHSADELVLLDNESIGDWIELPRQAWKISERYRAAFSDVLRIELLAKYGGIWSDATCLPTENLVSKFDYMTGLSGFFAFKHLDADSLSSWFLASRPNSYVSLMVSQAMRAYWKIFDKPITYYYMHQIWIQLYDLDDRFRAQVDRIPDLHVDPRALNRSLLSDYEQSKFEAMVSDSFVHKLSYKFDRELVTPNTTQSYLEEEWRV